ncbi:MAG: cytochrome c, mono- and diheme variant family, partial [Caulobacteraceae bacterium]|nr:cytochrome c, mono- and diheme variant family [Caulobacteraceae bacterium]
AANLAHIGSKFKTEKELQQNMLLPGRDSYWDPRDDKNVTAIATYANGRQVKGYLTSVSDFKLVIRDDAGKSTSIPLNNGEPKVRLVDKLQAHRDLLTLYQDDDMHNLTAYLASLK